MRWRSSASSIFLYSYFISDLFTKTEEDTVPNLIGENYDTLDKSKYPNFKIEVGQWRASDEESGTILDQSPDPGRTAKVGTTIELTISSGSEENRMPDLVNMTLAGAQTTLNTMSVRVTIQPVYETSNDVTDGYVIRTEPAKDAPLTDGQTVVIYVSQGTAAETTRVPALVGLPVEEAKELIEKAGLSTGSATAVESDLPEGTVTFQSVDAEEEVRKGTVINLQISRGPTDAAAPIILSQSESTTVARSASLTLEVRAETQDKGVLSYAWYLTPTGSTDDGVLVSSRETCDVDTSTPGVYYYFCKIVNTLGDETAFVYSDTVRVTVEDAGREFILHVRMPSERGKYMVSVMVGDELQIEPYEVDMDENAGRDIEIPVKGSGLLLVVVYLDGVEYDRQLIDFDLEGY